MYPAGTWDPVSTSDSDFIRDITYGSNEGDAKKNPAVHANPKASVVGKEDIRHADLNHRFDRSVHEPDDDSIGVPLAGGRDIRSPNGTGDHTQPANEETWPPSKRQTHRLPQKPVAPAEKEVLNTDALVESRDRNSCFR